MNYEQAEQAIRWLPFRNDSGEQIPSYACIGLEPEASTGSQSPAFSWDAARELFVLKAYKPTKAHEGSTSLVAFNSRHPVVKGGFGRCTFDLPARVLHDQKSESLKPGGACGAVEGKWWMSADSTGFEVLSHDDPANPVKDTTSTRDLHVAWVGHASTDAGVFFVRNKSGSRREFGDVLRLDAEKPLAAMPLTLRSQLVLDGYAPVSSGDRFAVLSLAADPDDVVPARVAGIALARVDIQDAKDCRAWPREGEYVLRSAPSGPLWIMCIPTSSGGSPLLGVQLCPVDLDSIAARLGMIGFIGPAGVTAASGATLGSGAMAIYHAPGGVMEPFRPSGPTGDPLEITVYNLLTEPIDGGSRAKVSVETISWLPIVDLVPCSTGGSGGSGDSPVTPEVTNVTSPDADGDYVTTDTLTITVEFSVQVVVTGTPRLLLSVNEPSIYATYVSGSATTTLTFSYTVGSDDEWTDDLDYTSTSALELDGGTINATLFAVPADLTLPAPQAAGSLGANKAIRINHQTRVVVTSVSKPGPDGSFVTGDVLTIVIVFDGDVAVTGTPALALDSGGVATYVSGSGSASLTFTYTILTGEQSADLDYTSTSALTLPGGATIKSTATSLDADLTLPNVGGPGSLGDSNDIVVN